MAGVTNQPPVKSEVNPANVQLNTTQSASNKPTSILNKFVKIALVTLAVVALIFAQVKWGVLTTALSFVGTVALVGLTILVAVLVVAMVKMYFFAVDVKRGVEKLASNANQQAQNRQTPSPLSQASINAS